MDMTTYSCYGYSPLHFPMGLFGLLALYSWQTSHFSSLPPQPPHINEVQFFCTPLINKEVDPEKRITMCVGGMCVGGMCGWHVCGVACMGDMCVGDMCVGWHVCGWHVWVTCVWVTCVGGMCVGDMCGWHVCG